MQRLLPASIVCVALTSCDPCSLGEVSQTFKVDTWPNSADSVVTLYNKIPLEEREFTGFLRDLGRSFAHIGRPIEFKLGDYTVYTGYRQRDALSQFHGRRVTIKGKLVNLDAFGLEIWPVTARCARADEPDSAPPSELDRATPPPTY